MNPLVSIIIASYNGRGHLAKCLASLKGISYDRYEIILVDNGSADGTAEFVGESYPGVRVLRLDSNGGFAGPNNAGAGIAKGDYLLFLNNDTAVTENFVSELVAAFKGDTKIGICQSLLLGFDGTVDSSGDFIDEIGVARSSRRPVSAVRDISSARGASMMVDRAVFEMLGGFDERFFASFEDVDLGWRCWISGRRVIVVPGSVVYHVGGATTTTTTGGGGAGGLDMPFHGAKNQLLMKLTNFESFLAVSRTARFLAVYGIRELRIAAEYRLYGRTRITSTKYETAIARNPDLRSAARAVWWILRHPGYVRSKRARVNSLRRYSTRDLQRMGVITGEPR